MHSGHGGNNDQWISKCNWESVALFVWNAWMFLFLGLAGSAVKKQQDDPERKGPPGASNSQASSGSLAAAIERPSHRNCLEPKSSDNEQANMRCCEFRGQNCMAIERICASNGTNSKTPAHATQSQIRKSKSSEGHSQVCFSLATHTCLTLSSGIVGIALVVSNPKQRLPTPSSATRVT